MGKDCCLKHVMDGILTSQVTDTPVVSLDVAVLINSCLHYLLWVADPPSLRVFSSSDIFPAPIKHGYRGPPVGWWHI
jgi:hypothetical protein